MPMRDWEATAGSPLPLGINFIASQQAWNFALYSKHASAVTLHPYHENDIQNLLYTYRLKPLPNKSGRVWQCRIASTIGDNALYNAYQVDGPFDLERGHRFDFLRQTELL